MGQIEAWNLDILGQAKLMKSFKYCKHYVECEEDGTEGGTVRTPTFSFLFFSFLRRREID